MKNEYNKCFKWCVARFFIIKDNHPERVDKDLKKQAEKLNWEKIEFPVSLQQITLFEKNNQDISVNVYGYESSVYPLRRSKNINTFSTEESLSKHELYCDTHDSVRIELPEPNTMIEFTNYNRSMRVPFVVYADFESFITPINTCSPNTNESYTKQYQKHTPCSFCYYIKCFDESVYKSKPVTFTANSEKDDVAKKIVDMLKEDIKKIYKTYLKFPKKMVFTPEDKNSFNNAKVCHICEEELKDDRVKDHCHITDNKVIEVKLQLRFVDSYRFMASSLDSLSKNLTKEQCKNIGKYYLRNDLDLLLRKGVYPYEWVDSIDKLNETQLPPKELFFSRLNDEGISDEDY
nr:unnamed protein product [Hydra vulgaris]